MIPHQSEQNPVWRKVTDHPPPYGTKLLCYTLTGVARIGIITPGDGTLLWMPLPKLSPEQQDWARHQAAPGGLPDLAGLNKLRPAHYKERWLPK